MSSSACIAVVRVVFLSRTMEIHFREAVVTDSSKIFIKDFLFNKNALRRFVVVVVVVVVFFYLVAARGSIIESVQTTMMSRK